MQGSSFRRRVLRGAGAGLAVCLLSVGAQSAAWADDPGTTPQPPMPGAVPGAGGNEGSYIDETGALLGSETGGDVSVDPGPNSGQALSKIELANAYYTAKYSGSGQTAFAQLQAKYEAIYPTAADADVLTLQGAMSAASTARNLHAPWYAQTTSFYCGPASGASLLKTKGNTTSKNEGWAISQSKLALNAYMKTDHDRATKWAGGNYANAINKWREGRAAGYYMQVNRPAGTVFKNAAVYSIDKAMPLAADTVELAGGVHYNNHPNRTIGHWILAYAYDTSGARVTFTDSSKPSFPDAAPRFSASSVSFANNWLKSNGVVY